MTKQVRFCEFLGLTCIAGVLARLSEGALFENAVFNQLGAYGELSYLARGSEYEIGFVLSGPTAPEAVALARPIPWRPTCRNHAGWRRTILCRKRTW